MDGGVTLWNIKEPQKSINCLQLHTTPVNLKNRMLSERGAWGAQSVKRLTLDFSSGHDLMVCGIEPHIGLYADSTEPAWDFLSPSLLVPAHLVCTVSVSFSKINKH